MRQYLESGLAPTSGNTADYSISPGDMVRFVRGKYSGRSGIVEKLTAHEAYVVLSPVDEKKQMEVALQGPIEEGDVWNYGRVWNYGTPPDGLPGGSWWQSARSGKVDGDTLIAGLKNLAGAWVLCAVTFKDGETFENDNGQFVHTDGSPVVKVDCDRGDP